MNSSCVPLWRQLLKTYTCQYLNTEKKKNNDQVRKMRPKKKKYRLYNPIDPLSYVQAIPVV